MQNAFLRRAHRAPVPGCWPLGHWAIGPLGHWAVGPLVCVVGLLIPALEAHAGGWQLVNSAELEWLGKTNCQGNYEYSGTSISHEDAVSGGGSSTGTSSLPVFDETFTWGRNGSGSYPMKGAGAAPQRNTGFGHFKGKVRAWFVYIPDQISKDWKWVDDPNDKPKPLGVKITASGTAIASDGGSLPNQQVAAPNKLYITDMGAYKVSASVMGKQATSVPDPATGNSATATISVKVLKIVPTTGGESATDRLGHTMMPTPWCDFDVNADVTKAERYDVQYAPYQKYVTGSADAKGEYSVQNDTRSVKLSRGGRGEYSELKDGEWHTYGDSIYSVKNTTSGNDEISVPLDIAVAYSGGWTTTPGNIYYNVTPTWNKSGFQPESGDGDSGHNEGHGYGYTAYGSPTVSYPLWPPTGPQYSGSPTGAKTFDTSYTAKDNGDQATATAYYHLTLHDPVETIKSDSYIYPLEAPMLDGSGAVLAWAGGATGRPATQVEQTVKIGSSTEVGLDFTATTSVDALKGLLGFEAKAHLSSTKTMSIETDAKVPGIVANSYVYLIAMHSFQRTHVCFNQYDQAGKVKCFLTQDATGATLNPPQEVYHEAFRDFAFVPQFRWSDAQNANKATSTLPHDTVPPLKYDYSGHRS